MTIYEIDEAILNCIDEESGEIIDIYAFDILQMEREKKIENVACWRKNLVANAEAKTREAIQLKERAAKDLAKADRLDEYLTYALDDNKFETTRCQVSFIKSKETIIENIDKIPATYLRQKIETQPNKKAIKTAILSGEVVPGSYLMEKRNIRVK